MKRLLALTCLALLITGCAKKKKPSQTLQWEPYTLLNFALTSSPSNAWAPAGTWQEADGTVFSMDSLAPWEVTPLTITLPNSDQCSCKIYFEDDNPDTGSGQYYIIGCTQNGNTVAECTSEETYGAYSVDRPLLQFQAY